MTDLAGGPGWPCGPGGPGGPGGLWREVRVVAETGSTNADLLAAARAGEPEGLVLLARAQTAGRGRQGRRWESPPGAGLTFSVLLRPAGVPPDLLGWLPLLAGVAVASAVADSASVEARLKWPNDVLAGGAKLAGILAEGTGDAIVVGVGINVSQRAGELPGPAATSLALAAAATSPAATPPAAAPAPGPGGAATSRPSGAGGEHLPAPVSGEHLLGAVLTRLARWYLAWRDQAAPGDADACGLRAEYVRLCATIGQDALVMLPNDRSLSGRAAGVDRGGALEVITPGGPVRVSAGDVVQVRPAAQVAP